MAEPFFDTVGEGVIHTQMSSLRFQDLRDYALSLPKFGTSSATEEVTIIDTGLLYMSIIIVVCMFVDTPTCETAIAELA